MVIAIAALVAGSAPAGAAAPGLPGRIDPDLVRLDGLGIASVVFDSGGYLTDPSDAPAAEIALDYVDAHRVDFGLSAASVDTLEITGAITTAHSGATYLTIGQQVDGLPVLGATLTALVDAQGRLVLIGGRTGETDTSGAIRLTAGDAISKAAARGGAEDPAPPDGSDTIEPGTHEYENPYATGLVDPSPVVAEQVWYLRPDRSLRLAWRTDVEVSGESWYQTVFDAQTGIVLDRENNYAHVGPEGNVFQEEHPGITGATQQLTPFTGINGTWVAGTALSGNNVNAYRDRNDDDANNEYQTNSPPSPDPDFQVFDFAFTDAWQNATDVADVGALDADQDVALTQMFYYTNVMHDWLWGYGFDEASGNFQVANPSGNGTAGDPVLAESQDGWDFGCPDGNDAGTDPDRCLNNANFGTTNADGSTARMQMFMWVTSGSNPSRDGSMDGDVIAHEVGHGVSERLVPGGVDGGGINQSGSLGEGWSDTISFLKWGDAVVGDYATSNTATGVRSVAYDASNRTYGTYSTSVTSPHFNGEIWASATYDIRLLLGIDTTAQLVLDGMRVTANGSSSSFLDARDGILAADMVNNGGANQCALWTAFAGRGMGENAVNAGFHAAQVDETTVPDECLPTADANGPYVTPEGTDVALDGTASSPGTDPSAGAIAAWEWDLDDDGQYDDAFGPTPSFTAVGQDGVFDIGLRVTDLFGNTATDTSTVTVTNVAPTVTIDPILPIDEGESVTVSGTITDPGWLDDLSATIDFDDGNGAQPLTGVEENVRPLASLTFSVDVPYGDDGAYTVRVDGFDDDTSSFDTEVATIANVDPTATIDSSGEEVYDGVSAFVLEAGGDVTIPVNATDPGSDDLTFTWDWDDGTTSTDTSLVNPPGTDPLKSPSVQPRDVTLEATHTYAEACLYDFTATVEDDDGGSESDSAAIVVTGSATKSRNAGWWLNQVRVKSGNDFTPAEIQCYLDIASYFSLVFGPLTRPQAEVILHDPSKSSEITKFDEVALAVWLNFANGSVSLDTVVSGSGASAQTFGEVLLAAETVRINPASTTQQIKAQRQNLDRIVTKDG